MRCRTYGKRLRDIHYLPPGTGLLLHTTTRLWTSRRFRSTTGFHTTTFALVRHTWYREHSTTPTVGRLHGRTFPTYSTVERCPVHGFLRHIPHHHMTVVTFTVWQ